MILAVLESAEHGQRQGNVGDGPWGRISTGGQSRIKNRLLVVLAWAVALLMVSGPMFAHHGMEMYDLQRLTAVKGTVTKFDFINPHVLLHFDVKDDNGKVVKWVAETGSPNMMRRGGWNKNTLKPGDPITISGHPAKNGSPSMRFLKIVLSNGQELNPASGFD